MTRRETFVRLCELCQALGNTLQHKQLPPDQVFVSFHQLITLECTECKTKVSGDELFVLSQPTKGNDLTMALRRMRLGFCANPKCNAYYCTMTFQPSAEIPDWNPHLQKAERLLKDLEDVRAGRGKLLADAINPPRARSAMALALLLHLHQLYFGGPHPPAPRTRKVPGGYDARGGLLPLTADNLATTATTARSI
ncbi:MAG: hypothetical protein QM813_03450 [Verrucomicrobiota bacterium]